MASKDKTRSTGPRLRSGPNGLPRGQVSEIQRSRMLAAAVDAVEEVGYARMTVAQVIARARVSRKTFYDVFEDREDCFLAVFDAGRRADQRARRRGVRARARLARRHARRRAGDAAVHGRRARSRADLRGGGVGGGPAGARSGAPKCSTELREVVDEGRSSAGARVARATEEPPDGHRRGRRSARSSPSCTRACWRAAASRSRRCWAR